MQKQVRFNGTHAAVIGLSLIAFGFFVVNQAMTFMGRSLELHSTGGAILMTAFIALGFLTQFAKIVHGHQHWSEVVITLILIVAHIAAELVIWSQSQILDRTISEKLPQLIIGLYWLIGVVDVLALYAPREAALFRGESYVDQMESELQAARQQAQEATMKAALAEQAREFEERFAERLVGQVTGQNGKLAKPAKESKTYEGTCPDCGKIFSASSERGLTNALNGHKGHCDGVNVRSNGHRHEVPV